MSGDERERWGYTEISAYLAGQGKPCSYATLANYKHRGILPPDDATREPDRPRWWPQTIMAWDKARPGRGKPSAGRRRRRITRQHPHHGESDDQRSPGPTDGAVSADQRDHAGS